MRRLNFGTRRIVIGGLGLGALPQGLISVISIVDRAVLAAYCQAYGRWVEVEEKLKETPVLFKTPSGYVQQSPWLNIANRQMELMGRYMAEIGLTPASRSRIAVANPTNEPEPIDKIEFVIVYEDANGNRKERPLHDPAPIDARGHQVSRTFNAASDRCRTHQARNQDAARRDHLRSSLSRCR